mmetsp:Transcript_22525/g.49305  ORF Transcript_22525/g.49305 Transcript_22525/m.49305 type:complete len:644 (-) Transcript_22525:37-1968(-)
MRSQCGGLSKFAPVLSRQSSDARLSEVLNDAPVRPPKDASSGPRRRIKQEIGELSSSTMKPARNGPNVLGRTQRVSGYSVLRPRASATTSVASDVAASDDLLQSSVMSQGHSVSANSTAGDSSPAKQSARPPRPKPAAPGNSDRTPQGHVRQAAKSAQKTVGRKNQSESSEAPRSAATLVNRMADAQEVKAELERRLAAHAADLEERLNALDSVMRPDPCGPHRELAERLLTSVGEVVARESWSRSQNQDFSGDQEGLEVDAGMTPMLPKSMSLQIAPNTALMLPEVADAPVVEAWRLAEAECEIRKLQTQIAELQATSNSPPHGVLSSEEPHPMDKDLLEIQAMNVALRVELADAIASREAVHECNEDLREACQNLTQEVTMLSESQASDSAAMAADRRQAVKTAGEVRRLEVEVQQITESYDLARAEMQRSAEQQETAARSASELHSQVRLLKSKLGDSEVAHSDRLRLTLAEGGRCPEVEKGLREEIAGLQMQLSKVGTKGGSGDLFTGERSHLLSACGALRGEAVDGEDEAIQEELMREKYHSLEKTKDSLSIQCEELNKAYKQALEDKASLLKRHAQDRERLRLAHEASMESYRSQNSSLAEDNHELRSLLASRDSELQVLRARDKVAFIPQRSWGQL